MGALHWSTIMPRDASLWDTGWKIPDNFICMFENEIVYVENSAA